MEEIGRNGYSLKQRFRLSSRDIGGEKRDALSVSIDHVSLMSSLKVAALIDFTRCDVDETMPNDTLP